MIEIKKRNTAKKVAMISIICFIGFAIIMELIIIWYPSDDPLKYLIMLVPLGFAGHIGSMYTRYYKDMSKSDTFDIYINSRRMFTFDKQEDAIDQYKRLKNTSK